MPKDFKRRKNLNDDLALLALTDFLDATEAGIMAARQTIKTAKNIWDPSKINWIKVEGAKGPYERSQDSENSEFKTMFKDLASHGDRLSHAGFFFWLFPDGVTVGRKKLS